MAKIISKDADLKSILAEVIDNNSIFSSWVFDELTNPKERLDKIKKQKPNNLKDIINNYEVLHPKELSVTDDDSELIFSIVTWSPFYGFTFEPYLGLSSNEFLRLIFYKAGEVSWTFEYYYSGNKKSLLIQEHSQNYVTIHEENFNN